MYCRRIRILIDWFSSLLQWKIIFYSKDIPYSFRATILFLKNTFQNEGFWGLWRGNSATMARIIPYAAVQFTSHEQWKKVLAVDKDHRWISNKFLILIFYFNFFLFLHNNFAFNLCCSTNVRRFLAGSLAGITSQSCTYPLDLARARMAVTDKYTGYKYVHNFFSA